MAQLLNVDDSNDEEDRVEYGNFQENEDDENVSNVDCMHYVEHVGKDAEGETVKAKVLITTVTRSVKCLIIDSGYPGVHVEQDSAVVEGVIK